MTKLDEAWHQVNTDFRTGIKTYAVVARAYQKCADEMAGKKHDLQALHLERDWADFVGKHTNKAGRMVSIDPGGQEVPLLATDLAAAVAARDLKLATLAASKASWAAVNEPFSEATGSLVGLADLTGMTEDRIIEGKKSAQQFMESTLSAIGGLAGGAFGFAVVAP